MVKVAALLGVEDAYGSSRDALLQTTLLELSPNTIRPACHPIGEQVEAREATVLALSRQTCRRRASMAQWTAYLINFDDGWHEMKAGAFWTTDADGRAQALEYYTDTAAASSFGDLVWARAFARAANLAPELVFIPDGAHWIWHIVEQHFPQAIQIVDWFHASSYLLTLANAAYGESTPQANAWLDPVKTALYEGNLGTVIRACRALAPSPQTCGRRPLLFRLPPHPPALCQISLGLQIGSGSMESGCKQIALNALKLRGRNGLEGARKLPKARAAFLSHEVHLSFVGLPHAARHLLPAPALRVHYLLRFFVALVISNEQVNHLWNGCPLPEGDVV